MTQEWRYEASLPGDMTHTIQVETEADDVDFNLVVLDEQGNEVARDDSPRSDAHVAFDTSEGGAYVIVVELVKGRAGFSLKASSKSRNVPDPLATIEAIQTVTAAEIDELIAAHNRWRARYGVAPLSWSDDLATVASDWARTLATSGMKMRHRTPNRYGENIYWCRGKQASPDDVVDAWGSEVEYYDEAKNNWWPRAGHWSQVVWHNTTHVGGGVARVGDQEMWVCNYAPRGNWSGERPFSAH